jgi:hypothetical protein
VSPAWSKKRRDRVQGGEADRNDTPRAACCEKRDLKGSARRPGGKRGCSRPVGTHAGGEMAILGRRFRAHPKLGGCMAEGMVLAFRCSTALSWLAFRFSVGLHLFDRSLAILTFATIQEAT